MDFEMMPMPEEMREYISNMQARQDMAMDSYRHEVERMFEELSKEHLTTLRSMLHNLSGGHNGHPLAAYYEGQVATELKHRFNICPGCGVDHDQQMQEEAERQQREGKDDPDQPALFDMPPTQAPFVNVFKDLTESDMKDMEEYHLDDLREDGTDKLLGFVCVKCGTSYSSIEDRKLKDPDDCSGCHAKSRWG